MADHAPYEGKRHVKVVQGVTDQRVHVQCTYCNRRFSTAFAAMAHERTKHGKEHHALMCEHQLNEELKSDEQREVAEWQNTIKNKRWMKFWLN